MPIARPTACPSIARPLVAALTLLVTLAAVGCSSWTTYPPIENQAGRALTDPALEPVPSLMVRAIEEARSLPDAADAGTGTVVFNLPAITDRRTWTRVRDRLEADGLDARYMEDPTEPAYHVDMVRSRGDRGQVDVIRPLEDGLHELVTVEFRVWNLPRMEVERVRRWQIPAVPRPPAWVPETIAPPDVEVGRSSGETTRPG